MTPLRAQKLGLADHRALEEYAERTEDVSCMPQKKLPLAGGARKGLLGMTQKSRATKSPVEHSSFDEAEIVGHGRSLADHIEKLHGGAYRAAFMRGMSALGNPDVAATPVEFSNTAAAKMKGGMRRMVGAGPLKIEIEHSKKEEEMEGGVQTGRYEGEGKADNRKARAAVVKRVMRERGCGLAEASSVVKAEGLFKKK